MPSSQCTSNTVGTRRSSVGRSKTDRVHLVVRRPKNSGGTEFGREERHIRAGMPTALQLSQQAPSASSPALVRW